MFNMERIGLKISELRKAKNMTQMELADKMNISFQAVSNWERGNTMPDLSKLPDLARIFDVTIDDLLGEKSELMESVASGKIDEYLDNNEVTVKDLSEVAFVLKPEQVDAIFERTQLKNLQEVSDLLPFISRDIINQLARKAAAESNYHDMDEIAPYVDRTVIDEIARKMMAEGISIADIAPYMSRNSIVELAENSYREHGLSSLEDIAPYIPKGLLHEIADQEYKTDGLYHFETIAPFLNRSYLNELANKAIQKDGIKAVSRIAPFLDKTMLSEYVREKYL